MTFSIMAFSETNLYYYAECHYAECRVLFIVMLNVVILIVVMLSVVSTQQQLQQLLLVHQHI